MTMEPTALEESEGVELQSNFQRKVVRYGNKVVKSGPDLRPSEAEAMRFITANTNIPIPRLYRDDSVSSRSITMEFVEGERLDTIWNTLAEEQKLNLVAELREILMELRSLKGQYIGSLNQGPAIDVRRHQHIGGPFTTEDTFNQFLLSDTFKSTPTMLRNIALGSLRTDHEIVFTHGDFAPRNIIVQDGKITGILDWEYSGWYPEYWEYVKTFNVADHQIDWINYVNDIFPKSYNTEYINDRYLGSLLRH